MKVLATLSLTYHKQGPNETSSFAPETLATIDGPETAFTGVIPYNLLKPEHSASSINRKPEHDISRRIQDRGLSTKGSLFATRPGSYWLTTVT